jgi:hypothetical protein
MVVRALQHVPTGWRVELVANSSNRLSNPLYSGLQTWRIRRLRCHGCRVPFPATGTNDYCRLSPRANGSGLSAIIYTNDIRHIRTAASLFNGRVGSHPTTLVADPAMTRNPNWIKPPHWPAPCAVFYSCRSGAGACRALPVSCSLASSRRSARYRPPTPSPHPFAGCHTSGGN